MPQADHADLADHVPSGGRHRQPRRPGRRRTLAALTSVAAAAGAAATWSNASVRAGERTAAYVQVGPTDAAAVTGSDWARAAEDSRRRAAAADHQRLLDAVAAARVAAQDAQEADDRAEAAWGRVAEAGDIPSPAEQARLLRRARLAGAALDAGRRWVPPVDAYTFTSGFKIRWGRLHAGIDLAVPVGTPVKAMAPGRVVVAGQMSGYGGCVDILMDDGSLVRYGHLSGFVARPGDRVTAGQVVALSGNTGRSTGPHLHLEVHPGGEGRDAVDPVTALAARGLVIDGAIAAATGAAAEPRGDRAHAPATPDPGPTGTGSPQAVPASSPDASAPASARTTSGSADAAQPAVPGRPTER